MQPSFEIMDGGLGVGGWALEDLEGAEGAEATMMIRRLHTITMLRLSLKHRPRREEGEQRQHKHRVGGDLAFGLEPWVARRRGIWLEEGGIRRSNLEVKDYLGVGIKDMVMIMEKGVRPGVEGGPGPAEVQARHMDRVGMKALGLGAPVDDRLCGLQNIYRSLPRGPGLFMWMLGAWSWV